MSCSASEVFARITFLKSCSDELARCDWDVFGWSCLVCYAMFSRSSASSGVQGCFLFTVVAAEQVSLLLPACCLWEILVLI